MTARESKHEINKIIKSFSSTIDYKTKQVAIILAAGHGKRIKSHTSKMLHKIWDIPTVERVYNACLKGLKGANIIVVVGIKAKDVIGVIGKRDHTVFANQEIQKGTGHAVKVGLKKIDPNKFDGIVYVFPGDMGLIDDKTIFDFRDEFLNSNSDMMVLCGVYEGAPENNNYGRIIRVKDKDVAGNPSRNDKGKVIEILEYKEILNLKNDTPYKINFNRRNYTFSKKELIESREFNSGVYAFKFKKLVKLINQLKSDNIQKEIYITDLIYLFNKHGLTVNATSPQEPYVIMGFNNKSVLKQMEAIARQEAYQRLKDIIEIDDPEDFFIDETVIDGIIAMDKKGIPLDIKIAKGVYIGRGVKLNFNLILRKNVFVSGNVRFGQNNSIWENVHLSCYENQEMIIGDNVEILWGDIIKGNIIIGENSRIESSVNMTGSDEFPLRIGKNVTIKGTSYVFGSIIDEDLFIEHSVIIKKKVEKLIKQDGKIQPIKFFLPLPEGIDTIEDLNRK